MKSGITIILLLILVCSCVGTKQYVSGENNMEIIDLNGYSNDGFYVLPSIPSFPYRPVAIINYTFLPEANYRNIDLPNRAFDPDNPSGQSPMYTVKTWVWESIDISKCIDTVVFACRQKGANALCDFQIQFYKDDQHSLGRGYPDVLEGVLISGFAVYLDREHFEIPELKK